MNNFVEEYNNTVKDDNFLTAEYIEFSSIIILVEDKNYGAYIDFNDDNGYAVITGNYTIYDLRVDGDFERLRNTDGIYYSYIDGFIEPYPDGTLHRLTANYFQNLSVLSSNPTNTDKKDGQFSKSELETHIANNYQHYVFETEYYISNIRPKKQSMYSYYIKNYTDAAGNIEYYYADNGAKLYNDYYEGNCALTAMYKVTEYWARKNFIGNIDRYASTSLTDTIQNDIFYDDYGRGVVRYEEPINGKRGTGRPEGGYYKWTRKDFITVPSIYAEIRDFAANNCNYTPDTGLSSSYYPSILEYVINTLHNNGVTIKNSNAVATICDVIDSGSTCCLSITGSSTYGNHCVAVSGYKKYSYTDGWWIFTSTKYAYFYEIADGWNDITVYFDPNTEAHPELQITYMVV